MMIAKLLIHKVFAETSIYLETTFWKNMYKVFAEISDTHWAKKWT